MARPQKVSDEEILTAARACFLEHGASVSISRIAERLGVSQAALFKRFGTKQQLLLRAMMPTADPPWVLIAADGPDERPIDVQLNEFALGLVAFFRHMLPCMAVLRGSGINPEDMLKSFDVPPPVLSHRAVSAWFQMAMDQGRIRECDASSLAFNFIGAFHGRIMIDHLAPGYFGEIEPEAFVAHTVDLLMNGLKVQQ